MQVIERILLIPKILRIMIQVMQMYETKGFSVFKSVESHGSLIQMSKQIDA